MAVETMDYLGAARRFIRAAGKRVADADEIELAELVGLRAELEAAIAQAVHGQRSTGRSWRVIAKALGITHQSAWMRYAEAPADE